MAVHVTGEVFHWRGPAPHHFVRVTGAEAAELADAGRFASYGWGMLPVVVQLGATSWETSLWPKDGGYLVPLRAAVRRKEEVDVGDVVTVALEIRHPH